MDNKEFSKIRHELKLTQKGLSQVLCVSPKTIQSFEQGWRNVPVYVEREMLLLLALKDFRNRDRIPTACWEMKNCPDEWKVNCSAWEFKVGNLCWFINGTFCNGKTRDNWKKKMEICRKCEVFQSLVPSPR